MNKKSFLITAVLVLSFASAAYAQLWLGSGDANDPYQIWTAEDMQAIGADANYWDAHFLLMANIDLSAYTGTSFNIIGTDPYYGGTAFTGVFDGNGHTISNFTYDSNGINLIGVFGLIEDPNAEIKNLGLLNPDVNAGTGLTVGALVGYLYRGSVTGCYVEGGSVTGEEIIGGLVGALGGTIMNCYVEGGSVTGKYDYIGGLVGINSAGETLTGDGYIQGCYSASSVTGEDRVGGLVGGNCIGDIQGCHSTGSVSGEYEIGGLVGWNEFSNIMNCYSASSVTGNILVGGLVGNNDRYSSILNSYSVGSVTGEEVVGGLAGINVQDSIISDSYSTGIADGNESVGGLVGRNLYGGIHYCYSTGNVSGMNYIGGLAGRSNNAAVGSYWDVETSGIDHSATGSGLTTAQMQSLSTFAASGWGCDEVWTIDDGNDYPRLIWEGSGGVLITGQLSNFISGAGSEAEPFEIYTSQELNLLGLFVCEWDKYFKLVADIDLSAYTGTVFNIIGRNYNPFKGVFDGNGHTISNFTYDSNGLNYIGLFGYISDPNTEVKNLGLIDPNISAVGGSSVGVLVGRLVNGSLIGCYVEDGSVSGNLSIGGMVGANYGYISRCYSTGSVSGVYNIGGLAGYSRSVIFNTYSAGSVTGEEDVGGLVGYNYYGDITDCYSTGSVTGDYHVGDLVGDGLPSYVTDSFWDVNSSGIDTSGGGTGLPTVLMQTESTFTDAGWDFVGEVVNGPNDIWDICEGTNYPKLVWSIPAGDFICPDGVNMLDFAILGDAWFSDPNMSNWDPACDISDPNDNVIDGLDLDVFTDNYLTGF